TDLSQANRQVAQPKDINKVLKEQASISNALGNLSEAANSYADKRAKETKDKAWEEGGSKRRQMEAAVATLGAVLSGGSAGQVAVAALSPELNAQIHELTKDSKTANLLAHAALSALEAGVSGNNVGAGAVAGLVGEGSAMLLAETVFNKQPNELTTEEKNLLKVAGQLAGAVSGNLAGGTTADTVFGAGTAKRAVENNYLSRQEAERKRVLEGKLQTGTITDAEKSELDAINRKDRESDIALISACEGNRLSAECQVERQKLERDKFSYSGAEYTPTGYNYPTYTRYSDLYSEDYEKVTSFSDRYDVLKNAKVKANADFSRYAGLSENIVNKISLWGDFLSNGISSYSGSRFGKYDQYVPMNEQIKFHLSNEHGFDRKGIKGGHNLDKFVSSLYSNEINGKIRDIIPTPYNGIYDIYYQIPAFDGKGNNIGFKNIKEPKTVYDSSIYNDNSMYNLAKDAVATSYRDHIDRQGFKNYSVTYDGIRFRVYIDPNTGEVRNVHPSSK
ncbi:EndoU nuclease-like protein, partial [Bibersteinia trehalosi]|uniref:VENN motif pre-toxin domain-containing protein n=1 Tax=Bibersteinia trehalosi TaxID=47735 RepID=UPI0010DD5E96